MLRNSAMPAGPSHTQTQRYGELAMTIRPYLSIYLYLRLYLLPCFIKLARGPKSGVENFIISNMTVPSWSGLLVGMLARTLYAFWGSRFLGI